MLLSGIQTDDKQDMLMERWIPAKNVRE